MRHIVIPLRGAANLRLRTLALAGLVPLLWLAAGLHAQAGDSSALLFEGSCKSCHTIGGGRETGPDLKGDTQLRDHAWLLKFIQAPDKMLDSDATAMQLLRENNNKRMPNLDLEPAEVEGLLKMIEAASASGQVMGAAKAVRVATLAELAHGAALFSGRARFAARGPSCLSCHSVTGAAAWGGGRLGPDLTGAAARLGSGLQEVVAVPPFPTMRPVFTARPLSAEEAFQVAAYLKSVAAQPPAKRDLFLPLAGAGGLCAALLLTARLGRRRNRGVRNTLIPRA